MSRFISIKSEKELLPGTVTALTWTLLADGGAVLVGIVGRALFTPLDMTPEGAEIANNVHESILPHMSDTLLPAFFSGIYIAMVLSAIMSTIDSLLIVASSAAVRDYWQKTRHPDMPDDTLVSLSKKLTVVLALIAFAIGIGILLYDKENGLFWIIIFGWSGIAATFCPVLLLSLFWSGLSPLGAKASMVAGFASVPVFKFALPPLLDAIGWSFAREALGALEVLPPAFAVGVVTAVVVSVASPPDRETRRSIRDDLSDASGRRDRPA